MRGCHEFCGYRERTLGNVDRPGTLGLAAGGVGRFGRGARQAVGPSRRAARWRMSRAASAERVPRVPGWWWGCYGWSRC